MAYTANHLTSQSERRMVDFDPDGTSETVVTLNPADAEHCLALAPGHNAYLAGLFHSVGTGSVTGFKIFVSDAADGTGNAATVVSHPLGADPNAVGDTLWLEASAEQVKAAMVATSAYIGVKVTLGTGTDECVMFFERADGRFKADADTADYVS
jgi:hypothetical protein